MRILQYNIWNGCQGDPERLTRLGEWLKRQAYDVIGLNELNGWNQPPGIRKLGEAWGYPQSELFMTEHSPYFVGVLSKHPITLVEARSKLFNHGVLHVLIRGIHYLITHLTPKDSTDREKEASVLVGMIRDISEPLILMGDLNTLSPLDKDQHVETELLTVLQTKPELRRKFLTSDDMVNYRPMEQLLEAGLIDLCSNGEDAYSVPTDINQDMAHAARMRLDYILANAALMQYSPKARILREDLVAKLSDHYPVECDWDE